jgi:uncharacterized repeat protein (TIGR03943 family)
MTFAVLLLPVIVCASFVPQGFSAAFVANKGMITDIEQLGGARPSVVAKAPELPLPTKDQSQPPAANPPPSTPGATPPPMERTESVADYLQRTPEGHIVAEVLDLLYAAQDNVLRRDFEGKKVQLIGQLMPDKTSAKQGKRFKAVRMFMTCCAADARPVAALVETEALPDFPEMTWVKVTGTATFPVENGRRTSVLQAEKVEKTEPPEESMIY